MATWKRTPGGDIYLLLTPSEIKGLHACASDGAGSGGLLTCPDLASHFIGNDEQVEAAKRALATLTEAANSVAVQG